MPTPRRSPQVHTAHRMPHRVAAVLLWLLTAQANAQSQPAQVHSLAKAQLQEELESQPNQAQLDNTCVRHVQAMLPHLAFTATHGGVHIICCLVGPTSVSALARVCDQLPNMRTSNSFGPQQSRSAQIMAPAGKNQHRSCSCISNKP